MQQSLNIISTAKVASHGRNLKDVICLRAKCLLDPDGCAHSDVRTKVTWSHKANVYLHPLHHRNKGNVWSGNNQRLSVMVTHDSLVDQRPRASLMAGQSKVADDWARALRDDDASPCPTPL